MNFIKERGREGGRGGGGGGGRGGGGEGGREGGGEGGREGGGGVVGREGGGREGGRKEGTDAFTAHNKLLRQLSSKTHHTLNQSKARQVCQTGELVLVYMS